MTLWQHTFGNRSAKNVVVKMCLFPAINRAQAGIANRSIEWFSQEASAGNLVSAGAIAIPWKGDVSGFAPVIQCPVLSL